MKILQMLDIPWDSGLAHYALAVSEGLEKKGHDVFMSAIPGQKPWAKANRLGLKTVPFSTLKSLGSLRQFLKKNQVDLINAHTGSTHSLAVASALGQSVAVVRTRSDARAIKPRVGSTFLFNHTQRVIAAAEYIREAFIKNLALKPDRVVTVYQGVPLAKSVKALVAGPPVVGIVARLDPVKGHRYLLEAFSILKATYPHARLRVVGQEENIKIRDLRNMAERMRIDSMIEFEGFQPDVERVMAECHVGVIASTGSEAVSRVALEWMAAGRPLVATCVGCLPELVDEGKTGQLVAPKDAPALARAIGSLLHEPTRLAIMGQAGRHRVEKRFAMSRFVDQTLNVYRQAIAEVDGKH